MKPGCKAKRMPGNVAELIGIIRKRDDADELLAMLGLDGRETERLPSAMPEERRAQVVGMLATHSNGAISRLLRMSGKTVARIRAQEGVEWREEAS